MSKSWQPPQNLMQSFRLARRIADSSRDVDERIEAYSSVLDFCTRTKVCRMEQSIKKQTLMFWVYDKLGDAFAEKKDIASAIDAFKKSFALARSSEQKNSVLDKIIKLRGYNADMSAVAKEGNERANSKEYIFPEGKKRTLGRDMWQGWKIENLQRMKKLMLRFKNLRQKVHTKKQPPV